MSFTITRTTMRMLYLVLVVVLLITTVFVLMSSYLFELTASMVASLIGVTIAVSIYSYYYIERRMDSIEHNQDTINGNLKRLADSLANSEQRSARMYEEMLHLMDTMKDLRLSSASEKVTVQEADIKNMIKSIQENAELFSDIITGYEELLVLGGKEFVELDRILTRIARKKDISISRAFSAFSEFRNSFPDFITIEADRKGKTYVKIKTS